MGYVIAAVIVVLIVAIGVTAFVLSASRKQGRAAAADQGHGGAPGSDAAIVAPDEKTPLGDTDQHAGEQTREGTTVGGQDAERSGGTGRPVGAGRVGAGSPDRERGRTPAGGEGGLGGEAEGSRPVPKPPDDSSAG
jgi:hypothetical protein